MNASIPCAKPEKKSSSNSKSCKMFGMLHAPCVGSELDQTHREEVATKLSNQLQEQQTQIAQLESDIQKAETEREQHRHRYQEIKNQLAQREDIAQRLAEAEAALKEAENAVQTRDTLSAEINALNTQLRDQTQNSPDARALSQARIELEKLTYNPAEHRTLREKLKSLDAVEKQNAQLQLAAEQQKKALVELPEFRKKRDLAQQWLDEAKYAPNERSEREQVRQRIRTLNYNAEHHQRVSQQLAALQDAPAQYERLQVAERDLGKSTNAIQHRTKSPHRTHNAQRTNATTPHRTRRSHHPRRINP